MVVERGIERTYMVQRHGPGTNLKDYTNGILFAVLLLAVLVGLFAGSTSHQLLAVNRDRGDSLFENNPSPGGGQKDTGGPESREEKIMALTAQARSSGANELGAVPILVYHRIGEEEDRWTRTPENFRRDLEELNRRGYVLVPLSDYLEGNMEIPAGRSPAVITFDDSSPGQFRLLPESGESAAAGEKEEDDSAAAGSAGSGGGGAAELNAGELRIDPESAVGILLDFAEEHPGFGYYATFFVNTRPFGGEKGQSELWKEKLQMLVEKGFEIGNHTHTHAYLKDLTPEEVRKEIATMQKEIQEAVPGYRPSSFAVVQDSLPENLDTLAEGEYEGIEYSHKGILLWAWRAAESPYHTGFDPYRIHRIQVFEDQNGSSLTMWLDRIEAKRYISDGSAETIAIPKGWEEVLADRWKENREIIIYEPSEDIITSEEEARADDVKGVHVTFSYASSRERWEKIISLVENSNLNAVQLDVKDESGRVGYLTGVKLARETGAAVDMLPIKELLDGLREKGIYSVARIVVFRDPVLAKNMPQYMVKTKNGTPVAGGVWVNPYSREVWDYNIDLAEEAYQLGFDEVQFDYIRFPEGNLVRSADYGNADARDRVHVIADFLKYARERIGWGKRLSAAVFGFMGYAKDDQGIGQRPERMAPFLDYMSPMLYPSHYSRGNYGFENPNAHPYEVVNLSIKDFMKLVEPYGCRLRPWLQAFTLGPPPYDRKEIRAQIEATKDNGINTWLLWNASVTYSRDQIVP